MWLSVSEDGISVLDLFTMQMLARYTYDSIVTFGGCQDDFMMVVMTGGGEAGTQLHQQQHRSGASSAAGSSRLRLSEESSGTIRMLFRTQKPEVR